MLPAQMSCWKAAAVKWKPPNALFSDGSFAVSFLSSPTATSRTLWSEQSPKKGAMKCNFPSLLSGGSFESFSYAQPFCPAAWTALAFVVGTHVILLVVVGDFF